MRAVEASAKTREEAIQIGLKELGVEMYEVDKIEILDEGSKGLFGFGARPVKVRLVAEHLPDLPARKPERSPERSAERTPERAPEARADRGGDRERGGRGGDRERGERQDRPREERGDRGGRGGERGGERGGRQDREPRGERPQGDRPQGDRPQGDRPQGERGGRDRDRGGRDRDRGGERNRDARGDGRGDRGGRDRNRDGRGDRNDRPRRDERGGRTPQRAAQTGDSEFGYDPDHDTSVNPGVVGEAVETAAEQRPAREPREPREQRPAREPRAPRPERAPRAPRPQDEEGDPEAAAMAEAESGPQQEQTQDAEEASFAPLTDAQGTEAAATMHEIIGKMGITATTAFARNEDGGARLNIESEDSAILIGRKGRTLSAMQYLINRMISRGDTAENTERLIVDVGGYVDRRRESLEDMARNLAAKAKDTGRNMRLKPMSPQERRIIHVTLQDDEDVRTFSLGESLYRSVVISPKNARPDGGSRSSRGGRGRGYRGGRGRGGRGRDRFEVDAGQFGD